MRVAFGSLAGSRSTETRIAPGGLQIPRGEGRGLRRLIRLRRLRSHKRRPRDLRVGEDIEVVPALGRELRDNRSLGAGLKPVERVPAAP